MSLPTAERVGGRLVTDTRVGHTFSYERPLRFVMDKSPKVGPNGDQVRVVHGHLTPTVDISFMVEAIRAIEEEDARLHSGFVPVYPYLQGGREPRALAAEWVFRTWSHAWVVEDPLSDKVKYGLLFFEVPVRRESDVDADAQRPYELEFAGTVWTRKELADLQELVTIEDGKKIIRPTPMAIKYAEAGCVWQVCYESAPLHPTDRLLNTAAECAKRRDKFAEFLIGQGFGRHSRDMARFTVNGETSLPATSAVSTQPNETTHTASTTPVIHEPEQVEPEPADDPTEKAPKSRRRRGGARTA
jgi:hypothetical protein